MKDFMNFIREHGVIGLAIGFIFGTSVSKVVTSFVGNIVQPIIGAIFGSSRGLQAWTWGSIMIGNFLVTIIDFTIIIAVVYCVFKKLNLKNLDKTNK